MRKHRRLLPATLAVLSAAVLLTGCALKVPEPEEQETTGLPDNRITVGVSQLGAESDFRSANTESIKNTFTAENGYELIFDDGQQKQSNQITAIRRFIQQDVDYIVLAPVTETGWDTVLEEAKDANIPVIVIDRMVDVDDDSLFSCRVGSDFQLEGRKASQWLKQFTEAKNIAPEDLHIVNIQGNLGASAQIGRTQGLEDAVHENGWDLIAQVPGDFTQAKGREVMAQLLRKHDNINVVYCENDNEALGAIEAIEAYGKKPGSDIENGEIMIISFDGVKQEAIELALQDKITCIVECNPMQGPLVRSIIEDLEAGKTPSKVAYIDETIYCADDTVKTLDVDGQEYPVTILTQDVINQRDY